ncbi:cyclase family protein [Chondromyces apiculatus]|uniref:Putative cyclase n=1 Tax=Chondromyces apiculatus DSM 436 TaxID=1192034 RepID=A0A017T5G3_9BACT|nr:cyclase family protein [Chondromyces apiculatus]EYF04503.1 Putative cyclase [Chondromyces apiculatus DSM 436]
MVRALKRMVPFLALSFAAGGLTVSLAMGSGSSGGGGSAYDPYPGPSPWGPDDEQGASNLQTAERVLDAKKLIKKGKVYALGHEYSPETPAFPGNAGISMEAKPVQQLGRQRLFTELVHGEIPQTGTQFDALGHAGILPPGGSAPDDVLFYNRFTGAETITPEGLARLGVENVKPIVTRGVLLDVKRYANHGQSFAAGQEITLPMVLQTLQAQAMSEHDIGPGDVVLIVTGWEERFSLGTDGYYLTPELGMAEPGIGLQVARWLAAKGVACVGADNWGLEVYPPPGPPPAPGLELPVHHHLLVKSGVYMHESMRLSELAADLAAAHQAWWWNGLRSYEFFYTYAPVPLRGASGSPGIPLAIR